MLIRLINLVWKLVRGFYIYSEYVKVHLHTRFVGLLRLRFFHGVNSSRNPKIGTEAFCIFPILQYKKIAIVQVSTIAIVQLIADANRPLCIVLRLGSNV